MRGEEFTKLAHKAQPAAAHNLVRQIERPEQAEWTLDISPWPGEGVRPEPLRDAIAQQLTPETRLAILWIKDVWYQLPAYRDKVASTDIYDAVLQHGVRTLDEFDHYLVERGKSPCAIKLAPLCCSNLAKFDLIYQERRLCGTQTSCRFNNETFIGAMLQVCNIARVSILKRHDPSLTILSMTH